MTLGEWKIVPKPGMASANRERSPGRRTTLVTLAFALVMSFLSSVATAADDEIIREIKVEGNSSITTEQVRAKLKSRVGRAMDKRLLEADLRTLVETKWFADVQTFYDKTPEGDGMILIFQVKEMPILKSVEFRGRTKVKVKDLEERTGLKKGSRADVLRASLAVKQLKELYQEKGFELAEVKLLEGDKETDRKVVYEIFEGPQYKVASVEFIGNAFFPDSTLYTKVTLKAAILGLIGGKFQRDTLDEDRRKLIDYYTSLGFFHVDISATTKPGKTLGEQIITFTISEGVQYKVREIKFEGNVKLAESALRDGLQLHSGQPMTDMLRQADQKNLLTKYHALGCIQANVDPQNKFLDEPGMVDLVYKIEEGDVFYLGDLIVRGNVHTKDKVIRREAVMAGLLPGELLDKSRMDKFRTRLASTQYFFNSPEMGKPIDIKVLNPRPASEPYGKLPLGDLTEVTPLTRMQSPAADSPPPAAAPQPRLNPDDLGPGSIGEVPLDAGAPPPLGPPDAAGGGPSPGGPSVGVPYGSGGMFNPAPDTMPVMPLPPALINGGSPFGGNRRQAAPSRELGEGEPKGSFPQLPLTNMTNTSPDRNEPFANRSFADIVTQVDEAPTGRLMFGVGANSFQGFQGSFILHERNFDITNVPRTFSELFSGNSWRGGGQEFRLSVMPGTQINSLDIMFREPYLFNQPISFTTEAYLQNRYQFDYTEGRAGGRVALGKQFGPAVYADISARAENVNFYGFKTPAPADYLAAQGHTNLFTIRPRLLIDNRNNPFSPNKGSYLEFANETGFGTFQFNKVTAEARKYFTLWTRPDGTGVNFLTFRGFMGFTTQDTPVYERFFAGNFRSIRGFQYRGVGPRVDGSNVGGLMSAIGSAEYQFPWTANDMFQQVIFCDFGTVERNYDLKNVRVAVGTGLRVNVPALGPLPLAFDLAIPVVKADGDRVQYFNFFIGAFW